MAVEQLVEQLKRGLDAPICLTWELTYACNLACVHCLSSSGRRDPRELTTAEAKAVLDELHDLQVFYINIGGGEPMIRRDFFEIVEHAIDRGDRREVLDQRRVHRPTTRRGGWRRWTTSTSRSSLDGLDAATNDAVRGDGSYATARRAMDRLAAAGFGPFKISIVVTRHNVDQLDGFKALADVVRRPAARHPPAPVGPGRRHLARAAPDQRPAAPDLPLAARPRRRRAHRRLVLPPERPRRAAARPQHVRRRPRRVPDRPDRRRLRLPVRHPRRVPGRLGPRRRRLHRRVARERAVPSSCASRSRPGPAPSCGSYDACQGGCMAAKFFVGLPLDGPDPECVNGHGAELLAGVDSAGRAPPGGRPLAPVARHLHPQAGGRHHGLTVRSAPVMVRLLHRSHTDEVRRAVPRLTAARLTGNTLYRAAPPFLPQIAASLGVTIGTMGVALGVGELVGLAAPFVGRHIDHSDRRRAIITGLVLLAVAAALAASSPVVAMFAAASALLSLAKIVYDGGMGTWLADRVDYRRRAQVVGLTETAWAGAMLIGIPIMAVVAAASSWRVSYAVVGFANLVAAVVVWRGVAADPPADHAVGRARWTDLRPGLPTFLAVGLLMAAGQMVFVVFGAWLEDSYGFGTLAVGGVAFLLGVAELCSSTSTMRFTDRIGKRRAVTMGAALVIPAALGLGAVGAHVVAGIAVLFLFVLGFEFAIVSFIPLITEVVPGAAGGEPRHGGRVRDGGAGARRCRVDVALHPHRRRHIGRRGGGVRRRRPHAPHAVRARTAGDPIRRPFSCCESLVKDVNTRQNRRR